jgi:hypothetical protein
VHSFLWLFQVALFGFLGCVCVSNDTFSVALGRNSNGQAFPVGIHAGVSLQARAEERL